MKKLNKAVQLIFILILSISTYSQEIKPEIQNNKQDVKESIKPLRIGFKIGIPSLVNLNAEYVTPLLNNRVAIALDYFPLSINLSDINLKLNNFEIGTNVYIKNTGKGVYGGISYFNFNAKADLKDVEFDDDTYGDAKTSVKFGLVNLKLGAKLGRTFYFRIELGYGFGKIPDQIVITEKGGTSFSTEDISDFNSGLPLFNFGVGYSFL